MAKISKGYVHSSSAFSVPSKVIKKFSPLNKNPVEGDLVYGVVSQINQHNKLENVNGRLHNIQIGTKAIFVYGNRYAPDYYEALIPYESSVYVDLASRSGVISKVVRKNDNKKDPTVIKVDGYVCYPNGEVINTKDYSHVKLVKPNEKLRVLQRSKLILVVGTAMNSGKSASAASCCWSLSTMGYKVIGSKVTGTASLQDILNMQDSGAEIVNDFTYLGYPSTYLLDEGHLVSIFKSIDNTFCENPDNYWVVEISDGILQRETSILLRNEYVRKRINKLIFAATDAVGAIGGVNLLHNEFGLKPDAISGICSSSPLALREISDFISTPTFNNLKPNINDMVQILL